MKAVDESNHYTLALSDACASYAALKPPNRVTVAEGAYTNLVVKQPGAAAGPWSPTDTPYMVEPMNTLASRRHEACVFVGPARTGKALDVETPIPTPDGWKRMGDLEVGDALFGSDGTVINVTEAHSVMFNHKCYRVEFSDGSHIDADAEHLWGVHEAVLVDGLIRYQYKVVETEAMVGRLVHESLQAHRYWVVNTMPDTKKRVQRSVVSITPIPTRPVRCIKVSAEDSLFLAGEGMVATHNTAGLLLGWMSHNIVNDPGDMLFIQMTRETARTFSKTDVDRALRNSPNLRALKSPRAVDANTFDTMFAHGMFLRIVWPTVTNVSGSTYRYVAITDIDRMDNAENVDGEGPLFDLAKKRTQTFLSRGMTLVESSPGKLIEDPQFRAVTPHEAPPCGGILSLYNRSDRRRWYWKCPDCEGRFEAAPGLGLFNLPPDQVLLDEVRSMNIPAFAEAHAKITCPLCGSVHDATRKKILNESGIWVPDNVLLDSGGFYGEPEYDLKHGAMSSSIAGYWLGGVAAFSQSWKSIVENHMSGLKEFALTGSEEKLKQTTNTDQGAPYMSRHLIGTSVATRPEDRAEIGIPRWQVPEQTRCMVAAVDVQGGVGARFVVQVHAVGADCEQWLVDRFEIKDSKREGMGSEFAPIDPANYPEDWDVLTDKLLNATWPTPTAGLELKLRMVTVDTGGEDGVTHNAYAWYRRIRRMGFASRVTLYKGASEPKAPITKESLVGKESNRGKADVPLLVCNPNLLSDIVESGIRRTTPGPNYLHFPAPKHPTMNPQGWLPQAFFDELGAEVRQPNGTWAKVRKRNESFDLCRMIRAGILKMGLDKWPDWNKVPDWLAPLESNSMVITSEDRRVMKENTTVSTSENGPQVRVLRKPMKGRGRRTAFASL